VNVFKRAPHVVISFLKLIKSKWSLKSCICILRVEVPDGSYTLVPEDVNEGSGGGVHYVTVEQDPGQSSEDCLTTCANEGTPRVLSLTHVLFKFMQLSMLFYVHLRSGIEMKTLVA
jgi:hypothetical protein